VLFAASAGVAGHALAANRAPAHRPHKITPAALPPAKELSGAIPASEATGLPSTTEQYRALKSELAKTKPAVEDAKQKSEALNEEASALRHRLIATAARVQALEEEKGELDTEIAGLASQEISLSQNFSRDRVQVVNLLAVLERLQSDMPPVIALKPDDALGAARGAMLLGASLPRVYGAAAALATQLKQLRDTRIELVARRADGVHNAVQLASARVELDQLLAMKDKEADAAAAQYGDLQSKFEAAANEAADLHSLIEKVAALRNEQPTGPGIVVVAAQNAGTPLGLQRGSLLRPVVGRLVEGDGEGAGGLHAPGLTFLAAAGAQVIAPTDGQVLFAGPYHKTGDVLILETPGGYDLVLAGLERVDVRTGDRLLAGEPVGAMPRVGAEARLYFELRQNGKGVSPAPWLEVDLRKARRT
jgi:murein hydrolase activator